jgi:hypothetical protein
MGRSLVPCAHDWPQSRGRGEPRCTGCGHRQARVINGVTVEPRQTRSLPPWRWPVELAGRAAARRQGRVLRAAR